jgi:catechol 2,3-dioxygenase-like lactoylglutathione lyase family enzyme
MGLPDGVHHLAIGTRDMKGQLEFFTQVVGMELVALYWMHGVPDTFHAFLRMGDSCSLAFVQMPAMREIEPQPGVSHAGSPAGPVAPGAMQHVALKVGSEAALLALRDRIRSSGYWVMGPIDHGMCKSMYLAAPEGVVLEFAASTEAAEWIDPEVVALCGIDQAELARYCSPAPFVDRGGAVPQPDPAARPGLQLPPEMEPLRSMGDAEIASLMDFPTPPVPGRAAG